MDWKEKYNAELRAHEATKQKLADAIALIKEQAQQIERLKESAQRITDIRRIVEILNARSPAPGVKQVPSRR